MQNEAKKTHILNVQLTNAPMKMLTFSNTWIRKSIAYGSNMDTKHLTAASYLHTQMAEAQAKAG